VTVVKGCYILLSDTLSSVLLVYWREKDFSLHLVAKDFDTSVIVTTGAVNDHSKLGLLAADDEGNVQLFEENPK
jgi:hypothetical protein